MLPITSLPPKLILILIVIWTLNQSTDLNFRKGTPKNKIERILSRSPCLLNLYFSGQGSKYQKEASNTLDASYSIGYRIYWDFYKDFHKFRSYVLCTMCTAHRLRVFTLCYTFFVVFCLCIQSYIMRETYYGVIRCTINACLMRHELKCLTQTVCKCM